MFSKLRLGAVLACLGLAGVGVTVMSKPAEAWWRGGFWCCGVGIGISLPPVVVAPPAYYPPPAYYYPPPAYYPPPTAYYAPPAGRIWIAPHWQGSIWIPGHWS